MTAHRERNVAEDLRRYFAYRLPARVSEIPRPDDGVRSSADATLVGHADLPAVQADGGDIELVDVTGTGVVQIRFHGACHGCPSSTMTLHMGIERNIREKVPEITQVVSVP